MEKLVGSGMDDFIVKDGKQASVYIDDYEHLIFRDGVVVDENVIKLDFTSPILPSGSAITRYIDKEDGSEYIYSLFVPSDASTAFPVFDQPDLKARFSVEVVAPVAWQVVSNVSGRFVDASVESYKEAERSETQVALEMTRYKREVFPETKPISTYVFAFAAGPFERVSVPPAVAGGLTRRTRDSRETTADNSDSRDDKLQPLATAGGTDRTATDGPTTNIYVRKSQAEKFKPHAAEVFRLNREGIKHLEHYFDYKFPFPKYDIVLIPEFPFGGMEHAGRRSCGNRPLFSRRSRRRMTTSRGRMSFSMRRHTSGLAIR